MILTAVQACMSHPAAGLAADLMMDHLIIPPERAVKEDERRIFEAGAQRGIDVRTARYVKELRSLARHFEADRRARFPANLDLTGFEIERNLARYGEWLDQKPAGDGERLVERDALSRHDAFVDHGEHLVSRDFRKHGLCSIDRKGLVFPQTQQPRDMSFTAARKRASPFSAARRSPIEVST